MKKNENSQKTNFLKKLFIKLCRLIGFEIIDQSTFSSPTLNKDLSETLSVQGKKSITMPLGEVKIKDKVNSLKIILRTCTSELIMDQNKRRIFDEEKNEYTFRTLRSLIKSIAKKMNQKITLIGKINHGYKKNSIKLDNKSLNITNFKGYSHKF